MTIDLTGIAVTIIAGVFSVLTPVALALVNARVKDAQARSTLTAAIANSLGALQQAGEAAVRDAKPTIDVPLFAGVPASLGVGVQYVMNHAGVEAARLGVDPPSIADRITAQLGLDAIKTNISTAASPDPSPSPLAPIPVQDPILGFIKVPQNAAS